MLDERKASILKAVVNEFIKTGQPVGSSHIAMDPAINVSPATVRAEMAILEQDGYLTHPHTSAGRIPTDLGYRYFVDNLQDNYEISPDCVQAVAEFFSSTNSALDRILRQTSHLLAHLTHSTALVLGKVPDVAVVRSAQLVELNKLLLMLILVLNSGDVENLEVGLDHEISRPDLVSTASKLIQCQLEGKQLKDIKEFKPTNDNEINWILEKTQTALDDYLDKRQQAFQRVFIDGTFYVAQSFGASEIIEKLLLILEHHYSVISLLQAVIKKGNEVSIGKENGESPLSECSLVISRLNLEGEPIGTIGVLGPRRMNYQEVIPTVKVVSKKLEEKVEQIATIRGE